MCNQFVKLYYTMLNENPHVLYQFYGKDSTVVVQEAQEEGVPPLSVTADNQQVDLRISIHKRCPEKQRCRYLNSPFSSVQASYSFLVL